MKLPPLRNPVKEAIDHLPCGICFFSQNGLVVLCNIVMHRLVFALTGRDLQTMSELASALHTLPARSTAIRDGDAFLLPDGTAWQFSSCAIRDALGNEYTEYEAANVTKLYEKQKKLKHSSAEREKLAAHMRRIVDNVTAITREEEILTMKMQLHNEVGWCLQTIRQYYAEGCPPEEKDVIVAELNKMVGSLQGEIGHDDEPDLLGELRRAAATLGVGIVAEGALPENEAAEILIVAAIRECVTNTLRHAGGNQVSAVLTQNGFCARARITNNGRQPQGPIIEGGGFTSLRRHIEKAGGTMAVQSLPRFALTVTVPLEGGGERA